MGAAGRRVVGRAPAVQGLTSQGALHRCDCRLWPGGANRALCNESDLREHCDVQAWRATPTVECGNNRATQAAPLHPH